MKEIAYIALLCLLVTSCNGNNKIHQQSGMTVHLSEDATQLELHDFIPEELPDSSKVSAIDAYLKAVNADSTLEHVVFYDSTLYDSIYAFFKGNELVRMERGEALANPEYGYRIFLDGNNASWFFLKDQLLSYSSFCAHFIVTAMCNPVSYFESYHFYNDSIIHQEIDDKVGNYFLCGCGVPFYPQSGEPIQVRIVNSAQKRLKKAYAVREELSSI